MTIARTTAASPISPTDTTDAEATLLTEGAELTAARAVVVETTARSAIHLP
jgi:hypothetical protein